MIIDNIKNRGNESAGIKINAEELNALSRRILRMVTRGILRADFLREVERMLAKFCDCDEIELRLKERSRHFCAVFSKDKDPDFNLRVIPAGDTDDSPIFPGPEAANDLERLCHRVTAGMIDSNLVFATHNGSIWINNTAAPVFLGSNSSVPFLAGGQFPSIAIIPYLIDSDAKNLLFLKSRNKNYFNKETIELLEVFAQNLGVALVHRYAQVAVRERVKELTCLYGLARLVASPEISLGEILRNAAELLPPAWLYPEIASARIIVDQCPYQTSNFSEGIGKLSANIIIGGLSRGTIEVHYSKEKTILDEGPFLREERHLIDTIAREIAVIIERRQGEEDRARLQEQLRHADRLATIGQLAAGVAHELNEPLGSILGFAQLIKKYPELPPGIEKDLQKIIGASLHAREVIKKLMVFARQMPPKKSALNLNQVVEDGIYFLESRCAKAGIELVRKFAPNLPEIIADASQMHQVFVNLVVNSIQAMPDGGRLTIGTAARPDRVMLIIEDTGLGMNDEVQKKIFIPFFTTKDVHEGTGLGLSVVHGIVTAHGGHISVDSKVGHGTRFEVELPIKGPNGSKENETNDADE
jgi:signal transduction histidine kinase